MDPIYCYNCKAVNYASALEWHKNNPCQISLQGGDCMEFDYDIKWCHCEVAA